MNLILQLQLFILESFENTLVRFFYVHFVCFFRLYVSEQPAFFDLEFTYLVSNLNNFLEFRGFIAMFRGVIFIFYLFFVWDKIHSKLDE